MGCQPVNVPLGGIWNMLKKLLGLGIAATLLTYGGSAFAGTCDDGSGNPDPSQCAADETCDPDSLTCVSSGGGDCTVDADCPLDTDVCDAGTCVDGGGGGDCT